MGGTSIKPTGTVKQCLYGSRFCCVKPHEALEVCITRQSQAHSAASLIKTGSAIAQIAATRLVGGIPHERPFNRQLVHPCARFSKHGDLRF